MPYEITWEDRGVLVRVWGRVTDEEALQSNYDLYADPRFDSMAYQLHDFSAAEVQNVATETVRLIAKLDKEASQRNPDMAVAIVAGEPLVRGLSNLYRIEFEGLDGPWKQNFFEAMAAARAWIAEVAP